MSTHKFYKQQIAKAEAAIRNIKIPPKEITDMLTQYHKALNDYYKSIQPDIDLLEEQIKHCRNGMHALRVKKSKGAIPDDIYNKYTNWLNSYLMGLEFKSSKPFIRQLLANGRWMLITAPNGYAGGGQQFGSFYAKTLHWLARVNKTTCMDGNMYCKHFGRLGKKEFNLYQRFVEEIENDTRSLEKTIYLADVFPELYSEKEAKQSKDE